MAFGSISLNFWYVVAKIVLNNDCFRTFSKRSLLDLDFDLERSRDRSLLTPHNWGVILKVSSSWLRIYIIFGICDLQVKSYGRLKPTMLKSGLFPIHSNLRVYVKIWHCRSSWTEQNSKTSNGHNFWPVGHRYQVLYIFLIRTTRPSKWHPICGESRGNGHVTFRGQNQGQGVTFLKKYQNNHWSGRSWLQHIKNSGKSNLRPLTHKDRAVFFGQFFKMQISISRISSLATY